MIEIRPVQEGDMEFVRANPFQDAVKDYPVLRVPKNSWTCVFDGEIVAIGGIKLISPGVGESWIIMIKQSRKDGIFGLIACRAIQTKLDAIIVESNIRHCFANVRADFPIALRFVKALGFDFQCEREGWFPDGTSSMLYAKVYK